MNSNDFFQQMCDEAIDQLASGKTGWRETDTNTLILACFGMLKNHLTHKLTKPLWFFAGSICTGIIGYLINLILRV